MKRDSERDVVEASRLLSDAAIRFWCRIWRFPEGCYVPGPQLAQLIGRSESMIDRLKKGLKTLKLLATEGQRQVEPGKRASDILVTTLPVDLRFTPKGRFANGYECQAAGRRLDQYLASLITRDLARTLQELGVLRKDGVDDYFSGVTSDANPQERRASELTPILPLLSVTSDAVVPEVGLGRASHVTPTGEGGKGGEVSSSQSVQHSVCGVVGISPTTDRIARDLEKTPDNLPAVVVQQLGDQAPWFKKRSDESSEDYLERIAKRRRQA